EEPRAVETTDLHVFDRLGLDGKIGRLCSRHGDETRRGAEEQAFHHLHVKPPVAAVGGFRLPPSAALHPGRSPGPITTRFFGTHLDKATRPPDRGSPLLSFGQFSQAPLSRNKEHLSCGLYPSFFALVLQKKHVMMQQVPSPRKLIVASASPVTADFNEPRI